MSLSIITVNLNNKNGLQKTMESILTQSCKDFEWIVIDGNSTDGSVELIKSHAENITYWVSEHDNGIYDAMNKGINAAKGEYILFLNSGDMLYSNDVIEHLWKENQNEDIIVYDILLQNGNKLIKKDLFLLSSISLVSFLFCSTFPHQSTLIKRDLFNKIGIYDLSYKYVADWTFFWKACILYDASYIYKEGVVISIYDMEGLSTKNKSKAHKERIDFLLCCYSQRMYDYMKHNCQKEKEMHSLGNSFFYTLHRGLIWLSNKF